MDKRNMPQRRQSTRGQDISTRKVRRLSAKCLVPLGVFFWPFLYLLGHVFPVRGYYTAIGNDFFALYCKYKIYLLACLSQGKFPLWSPAGGAGYPFRDNPFAQALYPFNLPLLAWYKIAGGYDRLDHQVFTILGVSIFALGLFVWLRQLSSNRRAILFSVLVMSVSFKITEVLRFPNAIHTAAWYPWILYAATTIILAQGLKRAITFGVLLIIFTTMMCTGGYPYFLYHSIFLFMPYSLIFLIKPLKEHVFGDVQIRWVQVVVMFILVGIGAGLICGPHLLSSKRLISDTAERPEKDFKYSTQHEFDLEDTVGSLIYPPASQAEGWYFFSITALLIVIPYLFGPRDIWVKLFLAAWLVVISYISYGRKSYLFIFLWKYMPGFASMRVWPRINIILVPILAWLVLEAYDYFEGLICGKDKAGKGRAILIISIAYVAILGLQLYMYLNKVCDYYWTEYFKNVASREVWFIIYGAVGFAAVLIFIFLAGKRWLIGPAGLSIILAALVFVAAVEMRHVGAHMWTFRDKVRPQRINLDVRKINQVSFRFRRTDYANTMSLGPDFSVGVIPNWYFSRYVKFLRETKDEVDARRVLLGVQDGTRVFFSEAIDYQKITDFLRDAGRYRQNAGRLLSYTGEELEWQINAPVEGYLSFIDNWDWGWEVYVDESPAKMELLFGTFKAVKLSPGQRHVRFCYRPRLIRPKLEK